jgi:hypothetical protein
MVRISLRDCGTPRCRPPHPYPTPPQAREATLSELRRYTESYVPTLRSDDLVGARAARRADETREGDVLPPADPAEVDAALKAAGVPAGEPATESEAAEQLSGDQAVSFALELEGYCPVTVAQREGLLLPAQPAFVARYRSRYYGAHASARL